MYMYMYMYIYIYYIKYIKNTKYICDRTYPAAVIILSRSSAAGSPRALSPKKVSDVIGKKLVTS